MGKSLVLIRIKVRSAHPAGTAKEEALRGFLVHSDYEIQESGDEWAALRCETRTQAKGIR